MFTDLLMVESLLSLQFFNPDKFSFSPCQLCPRHVARVCGIFVIRPLGHLQGLINLVFELVFVVLARPMSCTSKFTAAHCVRVKSKDVACKFAILGLAQSVTILNQ